MSLRIKTLMTIGAVTLCLLVALYIPAALILPASFAALEQHHMDHDLVQVAAILDNEAAALALTAQDWAAWDDTYQFVEDGNQAYVAANLPDQTLADLRLNLMAFVQRSGRVVFGKQFDLVRGTAGPLPTSLAPYLAVPGPLLPAESPPQALQGLIVLPEGILLVAAHPILKSDNQGSPRGILILGRWLNNEELARLTQVLQPSFRLFPLAASLPTDVQAIRDRLSLDQPTLAWPLGDDRIAGYRLLPDITGSPSVIVHIEQDRPIMREGWAAIHTLALALLVACLAFAVTALLVIERLVLRRLARIEADVRQIRADDAQTARVTVAGRDELARLAAAFNHTLKALQEVQRQLRVSEAHYRSVVETQTELICRWRPDTTLTFANSAYHHTFTLRQQPVYHLVPTVVVAEDRKQAELHLAHLSTQRHPTTIEVRVALPDGRIRWLQWVDQPIIDQDGQLIEIQSVGRDITEWKQAEEEQRFLERRTLEAQRLESLVTLASCAAHDFNNLLERILSSSEFLLHRLPAGSPLRPPVERIENGARRAVDLSEQLLAYAGQGRMLLQPCDLNELVTDLQPLLAASVAKSSTLIYDLAPGQLPILVDGGQIRQIVMNLVINAAEAIGYGEGQITVATSLQEINRATLNSAILGDQRAAGPYVCLEVSDTGAGIDPALLPHIFDPFATTKLGGHGLGLAAVLGIVRAHKGAITVSSTPGQGARFRVLLPPTDQPLPLSGRAESTVEQWRGYGKIIVIDDEPAVGETIAAMLLQLGFTPCLAHSAAESLQLLRDDPFGTVCVLLDLTVYEMSRARVIPALRVIRPNIPIVVMTSFDRARIPADVGAAVEVLRKPFTIETLRDILREQLADE